MPLSPLRPYLHHPAGKYYLFHSLWHIFMAEAFYLLYLQLEGAHLERTGSGSSDSLGPQLSSGSWSAAAALLQPAQRSAAVLLQPAQQLVRPRLARRGQGPVAGQDQEGSAEASPRMSLRSGKKVW